MNVYKIGYGSYEESDYQYLIHDNKYDNDALKKIVEEVIIESIKQRKASNDFTSSYANLHHDAIDYLITKKGFKEFKPTAEWSCFGWASVFINDWQEESNDNNRSLVRAVNKAGFSEKDDSMLKDTTVEPQNDADVYYETQNPFEDEIDNIEIDIEEKEDD